MVKPFCKNPNQVLNYIDTSKPVYCYRNLHKKCISVRQNGIVKCHTSEILLEDATFIVNQKGRERVVREKAKNVHAFIKGRFVTEDACGDFSLERNVPQNGWKEAYYNPYKTDSWLGGDSMNKLEKAKFAWIFITEYCSDVEFLSNEFYHDWLCAT